MFVKPAEENLILYLLNLFQAGKSYQVIKNSVFPTEQFYKVVGCDPYNSELVMYVLGGINKICCHTPQKKTPITAKQL